MQKPTSPANVLSPQAKKAAVVAALFAASTMVAGCTTTPASPPAASQTISCPEDPTPEQMRAMTDEELKHCLERYDSANYYGYPHAHSEWHRRGYTYVPIFYNERTATRTPSPVFTEPRTISSGSSGSGGSTYKSGDGGSFVGKGGSSTPKATS